MTAELLVYLNLAINLLTISAVVFKGGAFMGRVNEMLRQLDEEIIYARNLREAQEVKLTIIREEVSALKAQVRYFKPSTE